jgi:fatty-acyl-CoA synthase
MMLDRVDPAALERDRLAKPGSREIPMLGRPFPSVEVRVVDDEGAPLGERQVGRLQLRGESVTDGYITPDGFEPARDAEGWLDIGDEGYVADGQIVVCGRRKDVIIMGGRNIYPTDIERAAGGVPGVREGNVAAVRLLAGDGVARESFAVLAESRQAGDADAAEQIAKEVTSRVVAEVDARPAAVRVVPPGSLPKTPSGKLRRAAARALLGNTSD